MIVSQQHREDVIEEAFNGNISLDFTEISVLMLFFLGRNLFICNIMFDLISKNNVFVYVYNFKVFNLISCFLTDKQNLCSQNDIFCQNQTKAR